MSTSIHTPNNKAFTMSIRDGITAMPLPPAEGTLNFARSGLCCCDCCRRCRVRNQPSCSVCFVSATCNLSIAPYPPFPVRHPIIAASSVSSCRRSMPRALHRADGEWFSWGITQLCCITLHILYPRCRGRSTLQYRKDREE